MRSIKHGLSIITLTASSLLLISSFAHAAVTPSQPATKAGSTLAKPAKAVAPTTKAKVTPAKKKARRKKSSSVAGPGDPDLRSTSALVVDEGDASILFSRNADKAAPIASITKLMTALVILDAEQSLDEKIEISRDDRASDRGGPSRLAAGTVLSRGDLLHLALMSSDNRAAYAVGRSYPGGIDAMIVAMNAKAKALGMRSAHFADPTGLSSQNVASPSDLSRLVMAASRNPTIRSYSTDPEHTVAVGQGRIEFRNTNNLVRNKDWDIVVSKTGYTEAAGRCLVMKTVVNDRPVVIVLMNSYGKYTRVADAARIRRWIETGHPQPTTRSAMVTEPVSLNR